MIQRPTATDRRLIEWLRRVPHEHALPLLLINRSSFDTPVGMGKGLRAVWDRAEMFGGLFFEQRTLAQVLGDALTSFHPAGAAMMNQAERRALCALPDMVPVYRGTVREALDIRNGYLMREGWSWTTDRKQAEWFATRYGVRDPIVIAGSVRREAIIALLDGRGEREVILDPASLGRSYEIHDLPARRLSERDTLAQLVRQWGPGAITG